MANFGSSNKFAKNLRRGELLVPHLNNYFANAVFPDDIPISINMNKEEDLAFHPSSALKCSRELYAMLAEELPHGKHALEAQKNFMIGHMYHGLFQWIIVEGLGFAEWDQIEKEFDFGWDKSKADFDGSCVTESGNPYRVRGYLDVARCTIPNVGEYLVDIKTVNSRLYNQANLPYSTMEKYEAQVKLYLEFEDLPEAIILAIEKDSPHRFKEFRIQRDPDFVNDVVLRWESVVDAVALGELPDCTCGDRTCPVKGIYDGAVA